MTRDEAIASMKNDIAKSIQRGFEGWGDSPIIDIQGKEWTPNQLVVEAENHTAVGLEFLDTVYIPNKENPSVNLDDSELEALRNQLAEELGVDPSELTIEMGGFLLDDEVESNETDPTLN